MKKLFAQISLNWQPNMDGMGIDQLAENIRFDNGREFTARAVRSCLERIGVKTAFIEPGSPWENGYNESFNGKLGDDLLTEKYFTLSKKQRF